MNVRQLRDVLILQESHCPEDGNTEKADAIASFANLLQGYDQTSVSEFVKLVLKAKKHAGLSPGRPNRRRR